MKSNKRQNFIVALVYCVITITFCSPLIFNKGLPSQYDWFWPLFNTKGYFWNAMIQFSGWTTSIMSKSSLLLLAILGYIIRSPKIFFVVFVFLIHFIAAYSFYKFCRNFTTTIISFLSGLAYAFTSYIFIRTIVGFLFSLIAYAFVPIFLNLYFFKKNKKYYHYLFLGLLLSLIFAQIQAGLLIMLVVAIDLLLSPFCHKSRQSIKSFVYTILGYLIVNLPWIVLFLVFRHGDTYIPSGNSVTTLASMGNRAHSYRNMLMLSDHDITSSFFYPLSHEKLMLADFSLVWMICLSALFSKKNRQLILPFFISSLLIIPFYKGPFGHFGSFFIWFYNRFPQIMVFRETYHFEFLFAISLCLLFAVGLDFLWRKINTLKSKRESGDLVKTGLKTLFAGSTLFIILPYFTFNYAGYTPLRQIPSNYNQLNNYLSNNDVCHKIYYPPGLDFVYFKDDTMPGASNSDMIAGSIPISYISGGTSVLNTPSQEMFYQNELVSQFYENSDSGEFASLLKNGGIDCVVVRQDTDTKYNQAMNLHNETDPYIVKHWNQNNWLSMIKSKKGLKLEKQFGSNIHIYKINSNFALPLINHETEVGKSAKNQFSDKIIEQLPITDWANYYSYYKDGWSRGRYDFWRTILFTRLRQDFIYTDRKDSVLNEKVDKKGSYEVWARYLSGGTTGSWQLAVDSNTFQISKDFGDKKFIWKKLGDITLNGKTNIQIKNITGENAIADLILVQK